MATYDFQVGKLGRQEFETFLWPSGKPVASANPDDVLISNNAPQQLDIDNNANGLAHHATLDDAVRHAICELVERHLFTQVWWSDYPLIETTSPTVAPDYRVECYRPATDRIPFCLAVVKSESEDLWVCGTAVDFSMTAARRHAVEEACMLAENYIRGMTELIFQEDQEKAKRLKSIASPLSQDRSKHLISRIRTDIADPPEPLHTDSVEKLVSTVVGDASILITPLWDSSNRTVVRARSPDLNSVREVRKNNNEQAPMDPFL
ncbi:YcaO-like family protein [Natrialba aegyptia]|uniref:YcaO-like family protein n=1 Tax=Natrialba aegyptia TaxID=129789 RepID=UPI001375661A|nr:YcaO-like family protein [Natrialba aegyptia]